MIKSFLEFLGGQAGEEKPMLLLLGMGFFQGIFLSTYQVGAETLFLVQLGDGYLQYAFFSTGFLGILSTVLFVALQKRMNYSSLILTNIFLIFIFMAGMRLAFDVFSSPEYHQILSFLMFVMMGPITAITILGFWGVFGRMFDLRASKRIIGGIDTGALTATIIAFFSIPFIQKIPGMNNTYDLLLVAGIASFGVLVFMIWIVKSYNLDKATKVAAGANKPKEVNFLDLFKNPYLRMMSLFLVFSMGASVFVEYTYLSVTEINFPEEEQLSNFLSFFNGTIMIMSFLIQSFLNDLIIGRFGLKVALMTMPTILILFTVGGVISGHLYGYETKDKEFLFFFLFTVSAKAFTASLKDALENPAFKLFFLPIDIKVRFDVQTKIEGVVNEAATLIAGLMQIALGVLTFFRLIHYSYFILALGGVVIFIASRLFNQYKVTLKSTLEKQKLELKGNGTRNEYSILNIIDSEIKSKNIARIMNGLSVLELVDPIKFGYTLLDMLNIRYASIREYAYQKLEEHLYFEAIEIIKKDAKTEGDEEAQYAAKKAILKLEEAAQEQLTEVGMRLMIRSTDSKNRVRAARLLFKAADEDKYLPYIMELLRDINPRVRVAALVTAGKLKRVELWPILVENLHVAAYSNAAMSGLVAGGEACFHTLDTAFYKTGQHPETMLRIIQIFGRVGGKTAIEMLWKKIDYPDRKIVSQILLSLSYQGFQARDFQSARIKIIVESEIGDIAWNIKTTLDIPKKRQIDVMIREAFLEEDDINYDNIFMLLSMIYDSQNVTLIRENILDGTTDSITFAVEMMDVFVEDELKPKLFPVLDDLKVDEKLSKLNNYYPPEYFDSYDDLLLQVINRDYNRVNRYTKALALYRIGQFDDAQVTPDIVANLFNPDPFLLQTAAYTIYSIDKDIYHRHTKRLSNVIKKELDKAIVPPVFKEEDEDFHQKMLLIERVLFLKSIKEFEQIPGELITYIAELLKETRVQDGTELIEEGEGGSVPVYIVVDGDVDIYVEDDLVGKKSKGGVIGHELILESDSFEYTALTRNQCTLLVLPKADLLDQMSRHIPILEAFLNIMNKKEEIEASVEVSDILLNV